MNEVENGQKLEIISKVKSWAFEKINKIDKHLAEIVNKKANTKDLYQKRKGKLSP